MAKSYVQAGMQRNAKDIFHELEESERYQQDIYKSLASIYESEENIARAIKYYHKLNLRSESRGSQKASSQHLFCFPSV